MVEQSIRRANGFKQWALIAGIIVIGLLDLAFTTFINLQDQVISPVPQVAIASFNESSPSLPEPQDVTEDQSKITLSSSQQQTRLASTHYFVRARRTTVKDQSVRKVAEIDHASFADLKEPAAECRTVTYPFVGDYYVVRVTDDTNCLTSASLRSRQDRLVAKFILSKRISRNYGR